MKRIAFITCLSSAAGSLGVEKRMAEQAAAARGLGLPMDFIYVNHSRQVESPGVRFVPILPGDGPPALWRYGSLARQVDLDRYDALVLRWSGGDFSAYSAFFRENASRMVTEHHTKEEEEILVLGGAAVKKYVKYGMERVLGRRMLRQVAGIVGVTDEIAQYEAARSGSRAPLAVITNGIPTRSLPPVRYRPFDGKNLTILFPSTFFSPWQGLDRLAKSLLAFDPGPVSVRLVVVGNVPPALNPILDQLNARQGFTVERPGTVYGLALDELYDQAQLGMSVLGLHRKGMAQACALKTRDFAARGLPFVLGYDDPDFREDLDFVFRVPSDESLVDFDRVVSFLETNCSAPDITERMRAFAADRLDWDAKVKKLYEFACRAAAGE
ncbi:MAG: glycosyltransferase [Proteobacteria bacterium]|nr:glycosyltransferase [Pseudomonadota bacterium]